MFEDVVLNSSLLPVKGDSSHLSKAEHSIRLRAKLVFPLDKGAPVDLVPDRRPLLSQFHYPIFSETALDFPGFLHLLRDGNFVYEIDHAKAKPVGSVRS